MISTYSFIFYRSHAGAGHDKWKEDDKPSEHLPGDAPPPERVPELVHQPRDYALQAAHRAVHPQHDQHEEENDRPELGARQRGHGLGVNLEHEARALDNTLVHFG